MDKRNKHSVNDILSIYQYEDGFSFGTDAVLLSGFIKTRPGSVGAELGSGSGIIPILLGAHKKFKKIHALEIQEDYALLAKENIEMSGFSDKINVIHGDLKDAPSLIGTTVDFVFSNPPYMKKTCGYLNASERKLIARHEIHCTIEDVCNSASSLLQDKGDFFCIYRTDRLCDLFCALRAARLEPKDLIFVLSKPSKAPELLLCRAVKNASPMLKTRAPFIIHNEDSSRTPETLLLYEKGIIRY